MARTRGALLGLVMLVAVGCSQSKPSAPASGRLGRAGPGTITTVAGNGQAGFSGDEGPATSAELKEPTALAIDSAGTLYIADTGNHRVRKVDPSGRITTVAGPGQAGFGLDRPMGLAVDPAGNVYIADVGPPETAGHPQVLKVDPSGTMTTVAGNGQTGFSGDGGPATSAELAMSPYGLIGLALDSAGNLFVADDGNRRVRKVDRSGKIATVAGNGRSGISGDGGPATSAQLGAVSGLAVNSSGGLLIAGGLSDRVRLVGPTGLVTTVAGSVRDPFCAGRDVGDCFNTGPNFGGDGGPATMAKLATPTGLAVDSTGSIYIADTNNRRVRKVDSSGTITTVAGGPEGGFGGDGGPATQAELNVAMGVATDSAGNLYVADAGNHRVRRVTLARDVP